MFGWITGKGSASKEKDAASVPPASTTSTTSTSSTRNSSASHSRSGSRSGSISEAVPNHTPSTNEAAPTPRRANGVAFSTNTVAKSPHGSPLTIDDDAYWHSALTAMTLEPNQMLMAGSYPPVTETVYAALAPRILDLHGSVTVLRYKLVPSRMSEERFWRVLFGLVAEWHEQESRIQSGSGAPGAVNTLTAAPGKLAVNPTEPTFGLLPKKSPSGAAASTPSAVPRIDAAFYPTTVTGMPTRRPPSVSGIVSPPPVASVAAARAAPLPPPPIVSASASPVGSNTPSPRSMSPSPIPGQPQPQLQPQSHPQPHPPTQPANFHPQQPLTHLHPQFQAQAQQQQQLIQQALHQQQQLQQQFQQQQQQFQTASAAQAEEIRSLRAALAARDNLIGQRDRDLAERDATITSQTAELTTMRNRVSALSKLLSSALQIAQAPDEQVSDFIAEHEKQGALGVDVLLHSTLTRSESASSEIVPSPSSSQLTAPTPSPSATPVSTAASPAGATATATATSSPPPPCSRCGGVCDPSTSCRAHTGEWKLTKDSVEFFDLPLELRGNLRKEKQRRLAQVRKEMRFIVDEDDPTTAPGNWTCCKEETYKSKGCKKMTQHTATK